MPDGTNAIRWRYLTDGAFALNGFQVDNITLDGEMIGDAETADEGWTFKGFRRTTGTDFVSNLNAYFVDNRQYVGRDRLLKHLYSFMGYSGKRYNKVEFYANEPGALVTYWDTSYSTTTWATTRVTVSCWSSTRTRSSTTTRAAGRCW